RSPPHGGRPEPRAPLAASHLQPTLEVERLAVGPQADRPREEGPPILRETTALEDTRVLEEKRPLLGKKEREAREVDLAIVDLGGGEIGIERERGSRRVGELVEYVERRLPLGALRVRRAPAGLL